VAFLLLVRHGENDYLKKGRLPGRTAGIHLNERGREQAAALAQSLGKLPIKAVYSSPLERAVETAEPIAQALKLEIQLAPGLLDTHVGKWEGAELKKLYKKPLWKIVQASPSRVRFPQGESFLELQARVVNAIESIQAAHKNEFVAVIFHADPIKLVVAYYLGLPMDSFQKLNVDAGSTSMLALSDSGARLIALNLKPPFEFKLPKKKK
jgi:probable phosphomutase (TIGR03848 family)